MHIDDPLEDLHRDHVAVTTTLREKLEEHERQRAATVRALIATHQQHLDDLTEQIGRVRGGGGMGSLHDQDLLRLEELKRQKELSLRFEELRLLPEMQHLMYDVHLTREALEELHRHQRFTDMLDDAGPDQE